MISDAPGIYDLPVNSLSQSQLDFTARPDEKGYRTWCDQRLEATRQLARKLGLPLARRVEVWLRNEIRLEGVLALSEEKLFVPDVPDPQLKLIVDGVSFTPGEIVSCVAMD